MNRVSQCELNLKIRKDKLEELGFEIVLKTGKRMRGREGLFSLVVQGMKTEISSCKNCTRFSQKSLILISLVTDTHFIL